MGSSGSISACPSTRKLWTHWSKFWTRPKRWWIGVPFIWEKASKTVEAGEEKAPFLWSLCSDHLHDITAIPGHQSIFIPRLWYLILLCCQRYPLTLLCLEGYHSHMQLVYPGLWGMLLISCLALGTPVCSKSQPVPAFQTSRFALQLPGS